MALEIGLVLATVAAFLAIIHYFTREQPRRAWNKPLSYWVASLHSRSIASRDSGLSALEYLETSTPATVAILAPLVGDSDKELRGRAAALLIALARSSRERADDVERAMTAILGAGGSGAERAQSALVLASLWRDSSAIVALTRAIHDPDREVRAAAAFALGSGNAQGSHAALYALLRAMQDTAAEVRAAAMESLRKAWPDQPAVLQAAGIAVTDTSSIVREEAIHALAAFGPRARPFRRHIENAENDSSPAVRSLARNALNRIPLK